jgi:hypothetical protein
MLVSTPPFLGFLLSLRHEAELVGVFSTLFRFALPFQCAEAEVWAGVLLEILGCARDLVFSVGEIALGVSQDLLRVSDGFRFDIRDWIGRKNASLKGRKWTLLPLPHSQGRMGPSEPEKDEKD